MDNVIVVPVEDEKDEVLISQMIKEAATIIKPFKKSYSPSKISYKFCPRLWSLIGLGYVDAYEKIDFLGSRRMENGTDLHTRYHQRVSDMDIVYKDKRYGDEKDDWRCAERLLEHPSGIRGRYDAILDIGDEFLYVTDFKSINEEKFNELTEPYSYHTKQLLIYMGMIEEMYSLPKPICGRYIYESKSTHSTKEFIIPFTNGYREAYNQLVELVLLAEKAIAEKNPDLAPCTCRLKDKCVDWNLEKLKNKPKRLKM